MHHSALIKMSRFSNEYLNPNDKLKILDVGSYDVNGTHESIFGNVPNWEYVGLDMEAGPNVDIVIKDYNWGITEEYDVVISSQTLEHVEDIHEIVRSMYKALKQGGIICLITPTIDKEGHTLIEHRYPLDCWRILPDGMKFLLEAGGFKVLSVDPIDEGNDCRGIARKI